MENILATLCFLYDEYKLHSTSSSPIVNTSPIVCGSRDDDFDDDNSHGWRSRPHAGRSLLDLCLEELVLALNMVLDVLGF